MKKKLIIFLMLFAMVPMCTPAAKVHKCKYTKYRKDLSYSATCKSPAIKCYQCGCGRFNYVKKGKKGPHRWSGWKKVSSRVKQRKCWECGKTERKTFK